MAQVKDPVCGMMVDTETTQLKSEYKGKTYYFCAPGCKTAFDKRPEAYLTSSGEHGSHGDHGQH
ncbi:MAG: YHS domain-containing protein [Caldilineaceae bacterium]|nr:YHS domain-containing protein [Caldilineaceae bacterium]